MKYSRVLMVSVLAAAALTLLSVSAQAAVAVGRVIVTSGEVVAVQADNTTRVLTRKSDFFAGEILKTGPAARAQLRFIDGALMSLHPATEFRVDTYRFDATEKGNNSSATTLLKGGLRTITGLIAKENPSSYKITTPVATIGVRGTDFEIVLDNGLNVAFWGGSGTVTNDAGAITLGVGASFNFAIVADTSNTPVGLLTAPPALLQDSVAPPGKDTSDDEAKSESSAKTRQADNQSDDSGTQETDASSARGKDAESDQPDDGDAKSDDDGGRRNTALAKEDDDGAKDLDPSHTDSEKSDRTSSSELKQDRGDDRQRVETPDDFKSSSVSDFASGSDSGSRAEIPDDFKSSSVSDFASVSVGGFTAGSEIRQEFERPEIDDDDKFESRNYDKHLRDSK